MKKILAVLLVVVFMFSGCSFLGGRFSGDTDVKSLTERDAVVTAAMYPENNKFSPIGFFERTQYVNLTDDQKNIYIILDNAAYEMQTGYINVGSCSQRDLAVAYYAMRNDRPEYFWLPTVYALKTVGDLRYVRFAETEDDWLCSKEERQEAETEIRTLLGEYMSTLTGQETEYERELLAHDWLCQKVQYNAEALSNSKKHPLAWTVYGAFIDGSAVCEGYSKAMQALMFMQGINCGVVTGVTTSAHMWNYVKIGTGWYHLDVTANDTKDKGYHAFFNVTTEYITESYTIDPEVFDISDSELNAGQFNFYMPSCHKTDFNYFIQNGTYITNEEQLESTIVSEICRAVNDGKKSVEFCFAPEAGFVYGRSDIEDFVNIEKCVKNANTELAKKNRIKSYNYGGISGAMSFMISW